MSSAYIHPALDIAIFEPTDGHTEDIQGRKNHGDLQDANSTSNLSHLSIRRVDQVTVPMGPGRAFSLRDLVFSFLEIEGAPGYGPSFSVMCTHGPLRLVCHALGQQRFSWMVC